jgi:hypothetical protein
VRSTYDEEGKRGGKMKMEQQRASKEAKKQRSKEVKKQRSKEVQNK